MRGVCRSVDFSAPALGLGFGAWVRSPELWPHGPLGDGDAGEAEGASGRLVSVF